MQTSVALVSKLTAKKQSRLYHTIAVVKAVLYRYTWTYRVSSCISGDGGSKNLCTSSLLTSTCPAAAIRTAAAVVGVAVTVGVAALDDDDDDDNARVRVVGIGRR